MYDLLPVSWSSGAPECRFVAGVLVNWRPSSKMYDLLQVSWSRSGAPALRCTICCRRLGLEVVPHTKMYDLLQVSWSSGAPEGTICCRSIGAPALRCTICCRCLGLEVVPQH